MLLLNVLPVNISEEYQHEEYQVTRVILQSSDLYHTFIVKHP